MLDRAVIADLAFVHQGHKGHLDDLRITFSQNTLRRCDNTVNRRSLGHQPAPAGQENADSGDQCNVPCDQETPDAMICTVRIVSAKVSERATSNPSRTCPKTGYRQS